MNPAGAFPSLPVGATGVVFIGHFYNRGGYASLSHDYADAIQRAGIPCRIVPNGAVLDDVKSEWQPVVLASQRANIGPRPVLIICDLPTRFRLVESEGFYKRIGITIFETDRIPEGWAERCNMMDEIWLPSDFNVRTFTQSGVRPEIVRKVHIGIDTAFFANEAVARMPAAEPLLPAGAAGKFVFLYLFGLHYRKGFDILIRAFLAEFAPDEDVFLLMSCFPVTSGAKRGAQSVREFALAETYQDEDERRSALENAPSFDIVERWLSNADLRALYSASDAYVSTERASGWSLPCMEMMALGKPVAAVDWGGGTEFMGPDTAFLIKPGPLEPVDSRLSSDNVWYRGHQWPALDETDVRTAMRALYANASARKAKADAGQALIQSRFDNRVIGAQIAALIDFAPDAETSGPSDARYSVRETPLRIEPYELLWADIRSLIIANPDANLALVFPAKTLSLLRKAISLRYRGNVASLIASDGPASAATAGMRCDIAIVAGDCPDQILAALKAEGDGRLIIEDTQIAATATALGKDKLGSLSRPGSLKGKIAAILTTGGVHDLAWAFVQASGVDARYVLTDRPIDPMKSWRGLSVISIETLLDQNIDVILIADTSALGRRRLGELMAMVAPAIPLCDAIEIDDRRPVVDRESLFRASILRNWSGYRAGPLRSLTMFPAFRTRAQLDAEMARLAWFLPPASGVTVNVTLAPALLHALERPYRLPKRPSYMDPNGPTDLSHVRFRASVDVLNAPDVKDGALAIWSTDGLNPADYAFIDGFADVLLIDVNDHHMRSGFVSAYIRQFCMSEREIAALRRRSQELLVGRLQDAGRVYIFGTGPSLELAFEDKFDDGYAIVCNTIVRNEELLNHIKPKLIVAADADFHFGVSSYAARFRQDLCRAVETYGALFVCPEAHAPLMIDQYPSIADRIVGIPVVGQAVNLDLRRKFFCSALDNVLLQFLLPLASTLGKETHLYGFDGKRPGEKKFWNHSAIAQYTDMLDTVELCHPAFFFYRDYQEYFDRHSRLIEQVIEQGEARGRRYVLRTPSVVPALEKRYRERPLPLPAAADKRIG